MGGEHSRPLRRQQVGVEGRHGEPLVVDDVGVELAAQAPHVAEVLGRLEGAAAGSLEAALGAAAVEALAHPVAVRLGHRPVEEAAGQQLDLGAAREPAPRRARGRRAA